MAPIKILLILFVAQQWYTRIYKLGYLRRYSGYATGCRSIAGRGKRLFLLYSFHTGSRASLSTRNKGSITGVKRPLSWKRSLAMLPAFANWCLAKEDYCNFTFTITSTKLRSRNTVVRVVTRLRTAIDGMRISPKRPDRIWSPPSLLLNR